MLLPGHSACHWPVSVHAVSRMRHVQTVVCLLKCNAIVARLLKFNAIVARLLKCNIIAAVQSAPEAG